MKGINFKEKILGQLNGYSILSLVLLLQNILVIGASKDKMAVMSSCLVGIFYVLLIFKNAMVMAEIEPLTFESHQDRIDEQ